MPALTAPALAAAALLALAGALKLVDPANATGALRALRVPANDAWVRVGSAFEVLVGVAAVTYGGPLWWGAASASYAAFAVFVAVALARGTPIGTCGCFGREETPPHPIHVVVDLALAAVTAAMAVEGSDLVTSIGDDPGRGAVVALLAALSVVLLHAAFVDLPRALRAGR